MTFVDTPSNGQHRVMLWSDAIKPTTLAGIVLLALVFASPSFAQDLAASSSVVNDVTTVPPAEPAANFSLLGLFLSADWIVKIVMLGLLGASIWCWAIIVDKSMLYGRANRQMNSFERVFWSGQSLEDLYQQMQERPSMGLGAIFVAAMKEWKRSHEQNAASFLGVQARLDKVLDVAISRESDGLEKRLGFLATVASASPFIGLFGTV